MGEPRYPMLYQINTRVYLTALAQGLGRPATLDDFPESQLERLAALGFDWVWLLGVWQIGALGPAFDRGRPEGRREFQKILPDLRETDICGSCFAIAGYTVHEALGGDEALARLRARMRTHGLRLMLDFVPNHTALDHPWANAHPDYYVPGTAADLARDPHSYYRVPPLPNPPPPGGREITTSPAEGETASPPGGTTSPPTDGDVVLARGRDPYFPAWADTLQLNYGNPALQEAMTTELLGIAARCDGVRCDMSMLLLPEVFERTWGIAMSPFWPAALQRVRSAYPEFCCMAEVYWDLEWTLQQQGFSYTYDKRLYDRLSERVVGPVRDHLRADPTFQDKLARFLENHDEPRAPATFPPEVHPAAAIVTYLTPGLRFFHQGQREGHRIRVPVHLCRGPVQPTDPALSAFYDRLLTVLRLPAVREGAWHLLDCTPAWEGNETWTNFIGFGWEGPDGQRLLAVVNYAPTQSQCYLQLARPDLHGHSVDLEDLLSPARYQRDGDDLATRGLYLDLPTWGFHVFDVTWSLK